MRRQCSCNFYMVHPEIIRCIPGSCNLAIALLSSLLPSILNIWMPFGIEHALPVLMNAVADIPVLHWLKRIRHASTASKWPLLVLKVIAFVVEIVVSVLYAL